MITLKDIKEAYVAYDKKKHPLTPDHARLTYTDLYKGMKGKNKLRKQIIDAMRFLNIGYLHESENNPVPVTEKRTVGNVVTGSQQVTVVTGYRKGTRTKGKGDTTGGIIKDGRLLDLVVVIKIGADKMSDYQKVEKARIESMGGQYWVVRDMEGFLEQLNEFLS